MSDEMVIFSRTDSVLFHSCVRLFLHPTMLHYLKRTPLSFIQPKSLVVSVVICIFAYI